MLALLDLTLMTSLVVVCLFASPTRQRQGSDGGGVVRRHPAAPRGRAGLPPVALRVHHQAGERALLTVGVCSGSGAGGCGTQSQVGGLAHSTPAHLTTEGAWLIPALP